jgi:hypothetical protein
VWVEKARNGDIWKNIQKKIDGSKREILCWRRKNTVQNDKGIALQLVLLQQEEWPGNMEAIVTVQKELDELMEMEEMGVETTC